MTRTIDLFFPYVLDSEDRPIPYQYKNIIRNIDASRYEVTCFVSSDVPPFDGIGKIRPVTVQHSNRMKKMGRMMYTASQSYDVLQTGGSPRRMNLLSCCSRFRTPDLKQVHTIHIDLDPESDARSKYKRPLLRSADAVVAVSEHTARTAERWIDADVQVIYNGIDITYFRPGRDVPDVLSAQENGSPFFLFVGKYEPRKRVTDVVSVAERVPEATFLLRGSGSLEEEISSRTEGLQNVWLLDHLSKNTLAQLYANVTGFIFPSTREGCPTAVLEAMASGTPVVGYRATSMPELVTHGETGYLYETGDIDGLVKGVRNLCDRDRPDATGEAAREYVIENHSFERVAKEYEQIYEDVVP